MSFSKTLDYLKKVVDILDIESGNSASQETKIATMSFPEGTVRSDILAFLTPVSIFLAFLSFSLPTSGANPNAIVKSEADIEAAELCVDCHDLGDLNLVGTAHDPAMLPHNFEISCIDCHSGAATHVEDPSTENIGNPEEMGSAIIIGVCTQCHQPHMEMDNNGFDPHLAQGLSCLSCHSIHQGQDRLLVDDKLEFCSKCHTAVANQFIRTSNHPLTDGAVSCISCHNFTGKLQPTYAHGNSSNCASCHPMEGGPYIWLHEATSSFSTEGEGQGCVSCHMPHGSPNERLLTRPNNLLCKQCHTTPPLHYIQHGGLGSQFDCRECHTDIHGSNTSRWFLDPNLASKIPSNMNSCRCH